MSVMYEELRRNQEMDSTSIGHSKQQHSGVLMRYSSAPSSFFTSLIDNNNNTHSYANNEESFTTSNSEMDTMLSKLISTNNGWNNSSEPLQEFGVKVVKQEESESNGYSYGGSELTYQDLSNGSSNSFYGSFVGVNSMDSENCTQSKIGVRNCSNLIRQKSSPAGFFSSENGMNFVLLCKLL